MLRIVKDSLRLHTPALYDWLFWRYAPYPRLARKVVARQGLNVSDGPFKGLRYPSIRIAHRVLPKLLGTYEAELHPLVSALIALRPKVVVNVGCAEGYYAVGLARELPETQVVAFEANEELRRRCRQLAALNGVAQRIEVRGVCHLDDLLALPLAGSLVFMDCEGCEAELLDPVAAPGLAAAHVLVETHDFARPGVTSLVTDRFRSTHRVRVIAQSPREESHHHPALAGLSREERRIALDEERIVDGAPSDQSWVYLQPIPKG
jgi:predicted O-methyltransferase YrrM